MARCGTNSRPGLDTRGMSADDSLNYIPDRATVAGADFFRQHARDLMNMAAETMVIEALEGIVSSVGSALADTTGRSPRELLPTIFQQVETLRAGNDERLHSRFQTLTVLAVNNYLNYVSDLIGLVYRTRPETLISEERVSVSEVLKHESLAEFTEWLAEDRVNRLSFKGFAEIEAFIHKRLGIEMVADAADRQALVGSIALRNLLVHRRGIVDHRYVELLERSGLDSTEVVVGSRVSTSGHLPAMESAIASVRHLEVRAVDKFDLPTAAVDSDGWFTGPRVHDAAKPPERTGEVNA
jgi:hypothetical protein